MSSNNTKGFKTQSKPGAASRVGGKALKALKRHFNRLILLPVDQYESKHPDKVFCWLNYQRFQEAGFTHHNGWRAFINDKPTEDYVVDQLNDNVALGGRGITGMVKKNEMVLGWMPREEYEEMKLAEEIVSGMRSGEVFLNDPALQGFSPTSKETVETIDETEL